MQLEELTKEQLEEKVITGEYVKEELFVSEIPELYGELTNGIHKYNYFNINYECNSLNAQIQSNSWITTPSSGFVLSNMGMKIQYNDIVKNVYIPENAGNFSGVAYKDIANKLEEFLMNLFYETFDNTFKIQVNVVSMSSGRRLRIRLSPYEISRETAPAKITVFYGDNIENSLLNLFKWKDGQSCLCKIIPYDEVYSKNFAGGFPVINELGDITFLFPSEKYFSQNCNIDLAGGVQTRVYSIIGYRPKRKKIYTYKIDNNIYLYDNMGSQLYDINIKKLISK